MGKRRRKQRGILDSISGDAQHESPDGSVFLSQDKSGFNPSRVVPNNRNEDVKWEAPLSKSRNENINLVDGSVSCQIEDEANKDFCFIEIIESGSSSVKGPDHHSNSSLRDSFVKLLSNEQSSSSVSCDVAMNLDESQTQNDVNISNASKHFLNSCDRKILDNGLTSMTVTDNLFSSSKLNNSGTATLDDCLRDRRDLQQKVSSDSHGIHANSRESVTLHEKMKQEREAKINRKWDKLAIKEIQRKRKEICLRKIHSSGEAFEIWNDFKSSKHLEQSEGILENQLATESAKNDLTSVGGDVLACDLGDVDASILNQSTSRQISSRKDLSLEEKMEILQCLDKELLPKHLAKQYGVSLSCINKIKNNRKNIEMCVASGEMSCKTRRARSCAEPEIDRALLRWFNAVKTQHFSEARRNATLTDFVTCDVKSSQFNIANVLLRERASGLSRLLGKSYLPTDAWIHRWKHRHNLSLKPDKKEDMILDREVLGALEVYVNLSEIIKDVKAEVNNRDKCGVKSGSVNKRDKCDAKVKVNDTVCVSCGSVDQSHLAGCTNVRERRKDLSLDEKTMIVRALEKPGAKMTLLAKQFGVSISAMCRINKNRIDILARKSSGQFNEKRKRDRGSNHPEVERALLDWFRSEHEAGIFVFGTEIKYKAREIAAAMGKDFCPSESWVYRWRKRHNVDRMQRVKFTKVTEQEGESRSETEKTGEDVMNENCEKVCEDLSYNTEKTGDAQNCDDISASVFSDVNAEECPTDKQSKSEALMCSKCGVLTPWSGARLRPLRHEKDCPNFKGRTELTYESRAEMMKTLEETSMPMCQIASRFGVCPSSISRMRKRKADILSLGTDRGSQKRIRKCKEPEIAEKLYQYFMQKKSEGVHVVGSKLKEKASQLAAELGRDFQVSSGWLGRWRQRYNLVGVGTARPVTDELQEPPVRRKKKAKKTSPGPALVKTEVGVDVDEMTKWKLSDLERGELPQVTADIRVSTSSMGLEAPQHVSGFPQDYQSMWEVNDPPVASLWSKQVSLSSSGPAGNQVGQSVYTDTSGMPSHAVSNHAVSNHAVLHNMLNSYPAGMSNEMTYQLPHLTSTSIDLELGPTRHPQQSQPSEDFSNIPNSNPNATHDISHLSLTSQHQTMQHDSDDRLTAATTSLHQYLHPAPPTPAAIAPTYPHLLVSHHRQPTSSYNSVLGTGSPAMSPFSPAVGQFSPEESRPVEADESEQQVMEALRVMTSFVQKKCLGAGAQAALRTLELSVKGQVQGQGQSYTDM